MPTLGRDPVQHLIGTSRVMVELRATIQKVAPLPLPVLVVGPRGAGKELVAQALHAASGRSGRFVAFNACAIADSMFEDALFGHVRGAFTGAVHDAPGYLTEAHHGTAFFDEITGVAVPNQRKLLRVFETRTFRPVGARADRESDFRLISATNDDVEAMVTDGRFRSDLADRIGVVLIRVPSLRERMSDIPALAEHFLRQMDPSGAVTLSSAALRPLDTYAWPGNVRQLRHILHRAVLSAASTYVERVDVEAALGSSLAPVIETGVSRDDFERRRLVAVMDSVEWSIERAAIALGVHESTVYRRLRRHRLTGQTPRLADSPAAPVSCDSRLNPDGSCA